MTKNNNFDFLRFLFALFVVISHAYPLSGGSETSQWIYQITNGQIVLARIGLYGFFVISGFFIFKSLQRSKSLGNYYRKRFLRLFPGLSIVLVITVLCIPFVYEGTTPLITKPEFYTYLPYNLSLYGFQPVVSGVFDDNPYHSINGSLWTIRYEFSLYIALSLLFFIRQKIIVIRSMIGVVFVGLLVIYNCYLNRLSGSSIFGMLGYEILDLGTFFVCGSLLAAFNFEKVKNVGFLLFGITAIIISFYFNFFDEIKHVVLSITILLIGFIPVPFFSNFGRIGDMSYGIYIYSFPVQQMLMHYFKLNLYELMIHSTAISIFLGYFSWHLIEKKALSYKNKPFFSETKIYPKKVHID